MGYYTANLGGLVYAEVHDSLHDHFGEPGYKAWGRVRGIGGRQVDHEWDMELFTEDGDVCDNCSARLLRWLFDGLVSRRGRFFFRAWLGGDPVRVWLESPLGIFPRFGPVESWHEMDSWKQYEWLRDSTSGLNLQWECALEVPEGGILVPPSEF
jgi:hypothetical protein